MGTAREHRRWWWNNWDKLVWLFVLVLGLAITFGRLDAKIESKLDEHEVRELVKEEAPSVDDVARIDERVKNIQDDVSEMKRDIKELLKRR